MLAGRAVYLALAGTTCYALANVLLEYKLAKYNNLTVILGYTLVIAGLAFIGRQVLRGSGSEALAFPTGINLVWLGVLGIVFFCGDSFYVGAYTSRGSLASITCISILFPVVASLWKLLGSRFLQDMRVDLPTPLTILGYVLGAAAILCVVLGSKPAVS